MKNLPSRSLVFGTLALLIVIGLVLDELGALVPLEGLFLQLATPVQRFVDVITEGIIDTSSSWRDLRDLREKNEQLESLVDQLMIENVRLNEVQAENEDLRKKLGFVETYPQYILKAAQVTSRVIGAEPNNFMSVLIIDVGSRDGVRAGMPVVTERGLVGHIRQAGANWAKVLLIIDPSSSVAALLQSSRLPGVVSGRLGEDLVMDYLAQEEQIFAGEVVLTSGMGGSYPKSLVIGQIVEVEQNDIETFQRAIVHPSVDFRQLETVLVLTSFEPLDVEGILDGSAVDIEGTVTPEMDQETTPVP
ncbi:MAG: rod shape-determining protein MreC [Anaerolineae bacterium]|nr:rod shape-determining protein MreC [Anaerolineae bacterium]